jgi:hypothetical protein
MTAVMRFKWRRNGRGESAEEKRLRRNVPFDQVLKVSLCFIQILSQNTNMEDNLSCTPTEIREIAKNTVANLLPGKS